MLNKMRKHIHNLRFSVRKNDKGFSMVELIAAAAMSVTLAAAVTGVIGGTMTIVADSEMTAISGGKAQKALTNFTTTAREAATIFTTTSVQLTFSYRAETACELHDYQLLDDASHKGRKLLQHKITALEVPEGVRCPAVGQLLTGGNIAPKMTKVEIDNIEATSNFKYFATTGQQVLVPGDKNYVGNISILKCMLGSVTLTLDVPIVTKKAEQVSSEQGHAAFRNNTRGLGCAKS